MKKLIILFLLSVPINLLAQNNQIGNFEDSIIITDASYSKIVESDVPLKTKFLNAKQWIAKTYGDYKAVLQFEDEQSGKITIKGISTLEKATHAYSNMHYTLTIDCRNDKFRVKFENISIRTTLELSTGLEHRDKSYDEYVDNVSTMNQAIETAQAKINAIQADPSNLKKKEATKEIAKQLNIIAIYKADLQKVAEGDIKRKMFISNCISRIIKSLTESITVVDDF